ncbi:MAG: hypothetical protein ACT4OO_07780 [Nitrospiraceae bacterium]
MKHAWFLGLFMSLFWVGCVGFENPSEQAIELSVDESRHDGEKNLAAIRAVLSLQRERSSPAQEAAREPNPEPAPSSWPPHWLSSFFVPGPSDKRDTDLLTPYVPRWSSSPPKNPVTVRLPWTPESSSHGAGPDPGARVPTHIYTAPGGSIHPGTMRCVPDSLGGQRCHTD